MFNSKQIAGFLFFIGVFASTVSFAQTPQPQPMQQQQTVEVSDAELAKFANAFQQVRAISMQSQQQMVDVVQEEGMEIKRFNELHQAAMDPNVDVDATPEELEQHKNIIAELEPVQEEIGQKLEKIVTDEGFTPQRYEQIATALQNDPDLQERLRNHFQKE